MYWIAKQWFRAVERERSELSATVCREAWNHPFNLSSKFSNLFSSSCSCFFYCKSYIDGEVFLLRFFFPMMDVIFKTLSDQNRRRIIQLLKEKEMTVSELLTHFSISQASLSHHLNILKRANLVLDERRGQFIFYTLNQPVFEEAVNLILNMLV